MSPVVSDSNHPSPGAPPIAQPVWDMATRLFHWLLVGLLIGAWYTATRRWLDMHKLVSEILIGLLVFRLWWGLFGASTAKFTHFLRGPNALLGYLKVLLSKKKAAPEIGHNPIGGWSIVTMLISLLIMGISGLLAVDTDGLESGPLSSLIDFDQGRLAAHIHSLAFKVVEGLVCLHLVAIGLYGVFGRNLIGPMLTGKVRLSGPVVAMKPASRLQLGIGLVIGITVAAGLIWIDHLGIGI